MTAHEFQKGHFSAVIVVRYPSDLNDLASVIVKTGLQVAMVMSGGDQPETIEELADDLIKNGVPISFSDNKPTTVEEVPSEGQDCGFSTF